MGNRINAHFDPFLFEVSSLERAWELTLGDLEFDSGEIVRGIDRRKSETLYTVDFISDHLAITKDSNILDYGCGTGRIAKGLIAKSGCKVWGVDTSRSMLDIAEKFVDSEHFIVETAETINKYRNYFDDAVSLWVLQHCESPIKEIRRIFTLLKPGGRLLIFNENIRLVPTIECGFGNDGIDVKRELENVFGRCIASGHLNPIRVCRKFAERSFWAIYRKHVA